MRGGHEVIRRDRIVVIISVSVRSNRQTVMGTAVEMCCRRGPSSSSRSTLIIVVVVVELTTPPSD